MNQVSPQGYYKINICYGKPARSALSSVDLSIIWLGGLTWLSLQYNNPSDCFQEQGDSTQHSDGNYVSGFPVLSRIKYVHAFKDIHNAADEDQASNAVVVDVPVEPVLVILLRSRTMQRSVKIQRGQFNQKQTIQNQASQQTNLPRADNPAYSWWEFGLIPYWIESKTKITTNYQKL